MAATDMTGGFGAAMLRCVPRLRAYARSLAGNPTLADDLVQETLLRGWAHRARFEPGSSLEAWLVTILRNAFVSDVRRRQREVEDPDGMHGATVAVAAVQTTVVEANETLRALQRLPLEQREALVLVAGSGFGYAEAAAICGVAEGTMKSRVSRARARLEAILQRGVPSKGAG